MVNETGPKISERPQAPDMTRRNFLGFATAGIALAATGVLNPSPAEAQERFRKRFDSEVEAKQYADKNGLVLVQAIGWFGFLTLEEFESVKSNFVTENVLNYDWKSVRFVRIRNGQLKPQNIIEINEDRWDKKEKEEDTEDTSEDTEDTSEDTV